MTTTVNTGFGSKVISNSTGVTLPAYPLMLQTTIMSRENCLSCRSLLLGCAASSHCCLNVQLRGVVICEMCNSLLIVNNIT